jgi:hypothetical protein
MASAEQLFQGIIEGKVPRQVRLFAAQGLLPVSREDLLRLQVVLSADPDEELAAAAAGSLQQETEETIIGWVTDHEIEPMILDLLTRVREEETIWQAVAVTDNVSDETLRVLARHGTPLLQDIIMTNQVRIMGCLEILEDLKSNPRITPVVLRRVREFEEEFIEKVIAQETALEEQEEGISIEDAIASLRGIGAHIPLEETMPYPIVRDAGLAEVAKNHEVSIHGRIMDMTVREKVLCGLKGSREERAILINSRSRLVIRAVLESPKLSDPEVERFAQSRSVSEEVLRIITSNRRWLRLYGVVAAVVQNPKSPIQTSLRLLPRLNHRDLLKVTRNRNVPPVIRRRAMEFYSKRR